MYTPTPAHRSGRIAKYAPGSQLTPLSHDIGSPRDPPSLRMGCDDAVSKARPARLSDPEGDVSGFLSRDARTIQAFGVRVERIYRPAQACVRGTHATPQCPSRQLLIPRHRISGLRRISCFFGNSLLQARSSARGIIHQATMRRGHSRPVASWTSGKSMSIHPRPSSPNAREPTDAEMASSRTSSSPRATTATASISGHVPHGLTTPNTRAPRYTYMPSIRRSMPQRTSPASYPISSLARSSLATTQTN